MEVTAGFIFTAVILFMAGWGIWVSNQPKAVKRVGNRSLYVKWNKK